MDDLLVDGGEIELLPAAGATWAWVAPVRLRLDSSHPIRCEGKSVVLEANILAAAPQAAGKSYTDGPYSVPGSVASVQLKVDHSTLSKTSNTGGGAVATATTTGTFEVVAAQKPAMTTSSPPDPDKSFPKKGEWKVVNTNQRVAVSGKPAALGTAAAAAAASQLTAGGELEAKTEDQELTWVALELQDEEGEPLAGHRVAITLPDGRRLERRLNQKGAVRVSGIQKAGDCVVEWLEAPSVPLGPPVPPPGEHWVAVQLVDEEGEPLAGHRVEIETPDGDLREKTLNRNGETRVSGIRNAGDCAVRWIGAPPHTELPSPSPISALRSTTGERSFEIRLRGPKGTPMPGLMGVAHLGDGSQRDFTLDSFGNSVLRHLPPGKVRFRYPDPDDLLATLFAGQARVAFDEYDNTAMYEVLTQSPKIIARTLKSYDRWFDTLSGKGLLTDLNQRFHKPAHRHVVGALLSASGLDWAPEPGARYFPHVPEAGESQRPREIIGTPPLKTVIQGREIALTLAWSEPALLSADSFSEYSWFLLYDSVAVSAAGAPVVEFFGRVGAGRNNPPNRRQKARIKVNGKFLGNHTVICRHVLHSRGKERPPEYYEYRLSVASAEVALAPALRRSAGAIDPATSLEKHRVFVRVSQQLADAYPLNPKSASVFRGRLAKYAEYQERLANLLESSEGKERYPVAAAWRSDDARSSGEAIPVFAFVYKVSASLFGETWELVDWTDPRRRTHTSRSRGSASTAREAIQEAIDEWIKESHLPKGDLAYDFAVETDDGQSLCFKGRGRPDGRTTEDAWADVLGGVSVAVAVATLVIPVPGSRVLSGMLWASLAAGTASSAISIYQRHDEGFSNWKEDSLDTLAIVGNFFAAAVLRLGAIGLQSTGASLKAGKYFLIGDISVTAVSAVAINAEGLQEVEGILNAPELTPEQKVESLVGTLGRLGVDNALSYVGLKGSVLDLSKLRPGETLDLTDAVQSPEIEVSDEQAEWVVAKAEIVRSEPSPTVKIVEGKNIQLHGLDPSLRIPVSVRSVELLEEEVGKVVKVRHHPDGTPRAWLVKAERPELNPEIPLWKGADRAFNVEQLHPEYQVWVAADNESYLSDWNYFYGKLGGADPAAHKVRDHVENRVAMMELEAEGVSSRSIIRLCPISREANSSGGKTIEELQKKYFRRRDDFGPEHAEGVENAVAAPIRFADPSDLTKMLNVMPRPDLRGVRAVDQLLTPESSQ